jgi:hypothetical protein
VHLLLGEHHGKLLRILRPREERRDLGAAERLAVQEPESGEVLPEPLHAQLRSPLSEVLDPGPDLGLTELVGALAVELRERRDRLDVVLLGDRRVAAEVEILHHLASQFRHESLLGPRRYEHRGSRRLRAGRVSRCPAPDLAEISWDQAPRVGAVRLAVPSRSRHPPRCAASSNPNLERALIEAAVSVIGTRLSGPGRYVGRTVRRGHFSGN